MNDYLSNLKADLLTIIEEFINKGIISSSFNTNNLSIDFLSKSKKGHVSTNLLIIVKKSLIKNNYDLKIKLYDRILNIKYISKITIAEAGFINIFFKKDFLIKKLQEILLLQDKYGNNKNGKNKNINIEFVSANPTGPIHVAHMRGAVLGDVVASILESTGYFVTREYYVNDTGSQIDILGDSLFKRYQQLFGKKVVISSNEYPGEYLIQIAQIIADKNSDKWLNEESNKRKKYFKKFAIDELIKSIQNDLKEININFDLFTYESEIIKNKTIDKIFILLNKKNLLYEGLLEKPKGEDIENWKPRKQLLFKSSNFYDDKDRPFKKITGDWTYFANDAAYHYDKYLRKYSNLINIWGADHIGYISRLKSIVQVFSNQDNYLDIVVCQIVRLIKDGKLLKMSKREGNFITLRDIIKQVGKDPLRYFMISSKPETPMDFDVDKVLEKNKDNPVFYCQYAYARASSVINKSKTYAELQNFKKAVSQLDYSTISNYEWEIILKLLSWPYVLNQASILKQPHRITNYLENLCASFHSFWNRGQDDFNLRIIDIKNINKTLTKLLWIESLRIVLKKSFAIIGIEALEKM